MLGPAGNYRDLFDCFRWRIPARFNIGAACMRHARTKIALLTVGEDGVVRRLTFGEVDRRANRLANVLLGLGLRPLDRVGILLPQCPETAIAHMAIYKAGLVAVPLFTLFGPDALSFRLRDSGAAALVTDGPGTEKLADIVEDLPDLSHVLSVDGRSDGVADFHRLCDQASDELRALDTAADDPALIIYTSGTTGPPKGALHAYRVLLGHLPGVEYPHAFFPQSGDLFWTPADWAWIGGLLDVLLPSWYHGVPVVAYRARKFDPERALDMMRRLDVRNTFLPPTALKMMRQVAPPPDAVRPQLRTIGTGGETLGAEMIEWGRAAFGLTINEFYGQTECNLVVGNNAELAGSRPGSMGQPIPGHRVAILDEEGKRAPPGALGQIAVASPDPVMFLGYWNNVPATEAKFRGDWLLTGDQGRCDEDGYFWFVGRDDDVITSAGYRIGPSEVEEAIVAHRDVAMAAVIGVADPVRTQRIKAFVVLNQGVRQDETLAAEIQAFVKRRLGAHEYPRDLAFVDELPMTATGKIRRAALRRQEAVSG